MKLGAGRVISNTQVMPSVHLIWLALSHGLSGARAGQFYMVRCGPDDQTIDPLLRRPYSVHRLAPGLLPSPSNLEGHGVAFLVRAKGRGSRWVCARQEGDTVDMLGPLGHGFTLHPRTRNVLLVAGSLGIAPLMALADEAVEKGLSVTLLLGAPSQDALYPRELILPEVELLTSTEDGSSGHRGLVTALLESYVDWADQIMACGPMPMYAAMASLLRSPASDRSVQVCLEEHMACGIGACLSCAIETRHGMQRVCHDGPVFELRELLL